MEDLYNEFTEKINKDRVLINEPMSKHTSFKIGGPADIFIVVNDLEELKHVLKIAKESRTDVTCIGNGTNLLVKDNGIRGITIKPNFKNIQIDGEKLEVGSGVAVPVLARTAYENGLSGLEFACGIPGSVGGAVYMNAGAYDGEISFVIESAEVLDDKQEIRVLSKEELNLGYRQSVVMQKGYIVLSATFDLTPGDHDKIQSRVNELTTRREDRQPLEYPSAGSTFKRPEGYFAGKLIEDAGLKGYTVGGACVSEKHAGFVINKSNGTAKDVLAVIHHVQEEVKRQFGVELHPEVRILGED